MKFEVNRQLVMKPLTQLTAGELAAWDYLLAEQGNCRQAFLSSIFSNAASAAGAKVYVLIGSIGSEPGWFFPVQQHSDWLGRLGVFEPVGGVMSDYFGVVARDGLVFSPDEIFKATRGRFSACVFSHLDETQVVHGLSGVQPRIGLRTRIGNSTDMYWDQLRLRDKKLVYDTERREKKLIKEHGQITFEWQSSSREHDLAKLIDMKKNQYTRTGKIEAPLFDTANVALLNNLRDEKTKGCEGVLSVLRNSKEIIAMHFGLRCYDTLHVWFPVYNPKYAPYSPGRILLKHLITEAAACDVKCLDRGEGDNQAKRDFANEEHLYYRGFWREKSLSGQLAGIAAAIHWRI